MPDERGTQKGRAEVGERTKRRDWRHELLFVAGAGLVAGVVALALVMGAAMGGGDGDGAETKLVGPEGEAPGNPGEGNVQTAPTSTSQKEVRCGDILAPLDKERALPADCAPPDLVALPAEISMGGQQLMRSEAAAALQEMLAAARRDGFTMYAVSSYRSYADQEVVFQQNVDSGGLEYAERSSAKPGHSEHQLGTTTDLAHESGDLEKFIGTGEAAWVAENSWKFGFIVSYPEGKEDITGYIHEPWHVRYVGKSVASEVHRSGLTLHEYLLR